MTDNITALIAEARAWAALIGSEPSGARDLFNRLADALEAVTRSRSNVLLLNTQITRGLNDAEAERDRYRAEAESARKTGERILADALRYRAAIEEATKVLHLDAERELHDIREILARALNENGETDV